MNEDTELKNIKNKIVVMSGKGGVGKSTVAANLALELSQKGYKTGLLDIDLHGPSIPTILGLESQRAMGDGVKIFPIEYNENLKVMSVGFMIDDVDAPVIWRGPVKAGVIKQLINEVNWGELDYLVADCPPGTGDEPLSVIQQLGENTKSIIVTTPEKVAIADVRKSIIFSKKLNIPIIGVIENMSGFICPECDKTIEIFKSGGGEKMANEMDIPFLGKIPLDPKVTLATEEGKTFVEANKGSKTVEIFDNIVEKIIS